MPDDESYYVLGGPDSDEQCTIDYRAASGPYKSYCSFYLQSCASHSAHVHIYEPGELDRMIERLLEIRDRLEKDR